MAAIFAAIFYGDNMKEEQIVTLDNILVSVEAYRTNDRELRRLDYMNSDPQLDSDYYYLAETILKTRAKSDIRVNDEIALLHEIAAVNGVSMDSVSTIIPKVNVMLVGGKL
jgi:hypothetical protein